MTYLIAVPEQSIADDLKSILDGNEAMAFRGSFSTLREAEAFILTEPTDMAFIRFGTAALNAVRLTGEIRMRNPRSRIVFIGSKEENAVEAFEYGADGFLLLPLSRVKIIQMISRTIKKDNEKGIYRGK